MQKKSGNTPTWGRRLPELFVITQNKSSLHSLKDRFLIALHSPDKNLQTGLPVSPPEKQGPKSGLLAPAGHFLQVRFERKTCKITGIFSDFQTKAAGFLCSSDCMAEGVGFELWMPFPTMA
jgi:hypothetical protein